MTPIQALEVVERIILSRAKFGLLESSAIIEANCALGILRDFVCPVVKVAVSAVGTTSVTRKYADKPFSGPTPDHVGEALDRSGGSMDGLASLTQARH